MSLLLPGFAAVVTFAVLMVVGQFYSASQPGGSRVTDPPTFLEDLASAGTLGRLAGEIVMITGACVLSVAAAHTASAFMSGSIRVQLVRQPNRLVWLSGNMLALTVLTALLTTCAVLAVVVAAFIVAPSYDVPVGSWTSRDAVAELLFAFGNLIGCLIGFAVLGAALAVRLRSAIATIGAALAYGLFEGLVSASLPETSRFLPLQNLGAMAQGGTADVPYRWSLLGTLIVVGLAVTYAALVLQRRDVSD